SGRKFQPGLIYRADRMAEEGIYGEASRSSRRLTDPHQRVADQDRDGVEAEVLYGIIGALGRMNDAEAAAEMLRIYHDWLADFCRQYPERLLGLAIIPGNDPAAAEREVKRIADLGFVGVEMSGTRDMTPLFDARWEPLWSVTSELGLPIHFHSSSVKAAP